jgi:hypothetical protein
VCIIIHSPSRPYASRLAVDIPLKSPCSGPINASCRDPVGMSVSLLLLNRSLSHSYRSWIGISGSNDALSLLALATIERRCELQIGIALLSESTPSCAQSMAILSALMPLSPISSTPERTTPIIPPVWIPSLPPPARRYSISARPSSHLTRAAVLTSSVFS